MEPVITYYLEMVSPAHLNYKKGPEEIVISECIVKQYRFNKFLYEFIGEQWLWTDKLSWTHDEWEDYVSSENVRMWVAYCRGAIAGYYELLRQGDDVEIIYFGLAPQFIGEGLGGHLLSEALMSAWDWPGVNRVWVHTCTLDHPSALGNYLARGMKIFRQETD